MSNSAARRAPVVLVVLDGWGYRAEREGNAIALASTPVWSRLWSTEPRTLLDASGLAVGLPPGQMGNSEVGHLNLGAGFRVLQDFPRINRAIEDGTFFDNEVLVAACREAFGAGVLPLYLPLHGDDGEVDPSTAIAAVAVG